ncbi:MAG: hypothetical protein HKN70_14055, partial [Gammaproteobacteria bacterium]|nr:hypothetical protein [Gammaproteobacteria bacterium]
ALNVLTDDSLRVRLVRLKYVDSNGKKKPWTHLTFLIESEQGLAARRGLQVHHVPKLNSGQLDPEKTALVEVFQLLIANNDYSTIRGPEGRDCCHNVEIIGPADATHGLIPVPYDFDASGLVNTGYAAPPEKLPIKSVRKRYFRGRCKAPEVWAPTFAKFQEKRGEIISLFADSPELSQRLKKKTIQYVEKFYAILDNPKRLKNEITDRCYGR